MNGRNLLYTCTSAAVFICLATTAHAERLAFMPQGADTAAPPGFTDLCQRDVVACGATNPTPATLFASSPSLAPTSSVGVTVTSPQLMAYLRLETPQADPPSTGIAQLEAYRPAVDPSFVRAGEDRQPAPQPVQAAEAAPVVPAKPVLLDKAQMRLVNALNRDVNRDVHKANDFDLYGLLEFWTLPRVIDGKMYGDCEDYALEKRRRLIAAGVPAEAMSMAVAVTARGESHAVLVVSFESGDWVLDNLTPWATPWNELNYRWVARQTAGSSEWRTVI